MRSRRSKEGRTRVGCSPASAKDIVLPFLFTLCKVGWGEKKWIAVAFLVTALRWPALYEVRCVGETSQTWNRTFISSNGVTRVASRTFEWIPRRGLNVTYSQLSHPSAEAIPSTAVHHLIRSALRFSFWFHSFRALGT